MPLKQLINLKNTQQKQIPTIGPRGRKWSVGIRLKPALE